MLHQSLNDESWYIEHDSTTTNGKGEPVTSDKIGKKINFIIITTSIMDTNHDCQLSSFRKDQNLFIVYFKFINHEEFIGF